MTFWQEVKKTDVRCRMLADRHYSRQKPGSINFTRPGYNQVLYCEQKNGRSAVFAWWRPKWESGIIGTERKDKLRAVECTIFRNETRFLSSKMILEAIEWLCFWNRLTVDIPDGIITSVNSTKTAAGRAQTSAAGECFIRAGFEPFPHNTSVNCDTWLRLKNFP